MIVPNLEELQARLIAVIANEIIGPKPTIKELAEHLDTYPLLIDQQLKALERPASRITARRALCAASTSRPSTAPWDATSSTFIRCGRSRRSVRGTAWTPGLI